jgi:hypothetical protein
MGSKLSSYFDIAEKKGGLRSRVKLAMFTKMSHSAAQDAPDSEENIKIFEEAIKKI